MERVNPKTKKRPYNRAKLYPGRISVNLPQEIHDELQEHADTKGISLSQALREHVLEWWAQDQERPQASA